MLNDSQHPWNNKALKIDFTDARTQGVFFTSTQGIFFSQEHRKFSSQGHRASFYQKDTGRLLITRTQGIFLTRTQGFFFTRTQGFFFTRIQGGGFFTRKQGVLRACSGCAQGVFLSCKHGSLLLYLVLLSELIHKLTAIPSQLMPSIFTYRKQEKFW